MFDNDFEDVVVCEQKNFNTIMLCDIDRLEELEPLRTHFGPGEPCNHGMCQCLSIFAVPPDTCSSSPQRSVETSSRSHMY